MKESQLENKTAIATNDYVRMVDENGNSVKIKKDSFMAAIRDAFPSIISDGGTGGGSVLSIINGALKTRTDANLASVLGALVSKGSIADFNECKDTGFYVTWSSPSNGPVSSDLFVLLVIKYTNDTDNYGIAQLVFCTETNRAFYRSKSQSGWQSWKEL